MSYIYLIKPSNFCLVLSERLFKKHDTIYLDFKLFLNIEFFVYYEKYVATNKKYNFPT